MCWSDELQLVQKSVIAGEDNCSACYANTICYENCCVGTAPVSVKVMMAIVNGVPSYFNPAICRVSIGRAVKDLVHNRWVLGDRVFPRGPAPGVLEHCRGPVRSAGVPLGPPRYVLAYVFGGFGAYAFRPQ
jgi:hypothetical protein